MLKEIFAREGTCCLHMGINELILMAGEVIPGFEIFTEYVNGVKQAAAIEVPANIEVLGNVNQNAAEIKNF